MLTSLIGVRKQTIFVLYGMKMRLITSLYTSLSNESCMRGLSLSRLTRRIIGQGCIYWCILTVLFCYRFTFAIGTNSSCCVYLWTYQHFTPIRHTIVSSCHDRSLLNTLDSWLGMMTMRRNVPRLARYLQCPVIILDAYNRGISSILLNILIDLFIWQGRWIAVLPFVAKVLEEHCVDSRVLNPLNPWLMSHSFFLSFSLMRHCWANLITSQTSNGISSLRYGCPRVNTRFTIAYSQHPHTSEWFVRVGSLKSPGYATTFSACHNQAWNHTMFAIQDKRLNVLHQIWSHTPMYEPVLHSQVHCMNWHCIGFSWSWINVIHMFPRGVMRDSWRPSIPHAHIGKSIGWSTSSFEWSYTPMSMFPEHMRGQACRCFTVQYMDGSCVVYVSMSPAWTLFIILSPPVTCLWYPYGV